MPSVTQTVAKKHPHQRRARAPRKASAGKRGYKKSALARAMARGTRKHAAIARLVGKTMVPPKTPKYARLAFEVLKGAGLRLKAAEVKYTCRGETGIIDLIAEGPSGLAIVEVKTIGRKRLAWETLVVKEPQGWFAVNKRRAEAQVRRYGERGLYPGAATYVLYVFTDTVALHSVARK